MQSVVVADSYLLLGCLFPTFLRIVGYRKDVFLVEPWVEDGRSVLI